MDNQREPLRSVMPKDITMPDYRDRTAANGKNSLTIIETRALGDTVVRRLLSCRTILLVSGLVFSMIQCSMAGETLKPFYHCSVSSVATAVAGLCFCYLDISRFHMEGTDLWIGCDDSVTVRRIERGRWYSVEKIYTFRLENDDLRHLFDELRSLKWQEIKINDRTGVPDEVRDCFAVRDEAGTLRWFTLWADDWAKQPEPVKQARLIVDKLLSVAKDMKPISSRKLKSVGEYWPDNIEREKQSE